MRLNITRPFIAYLGNRLDLTPEQEDVALFGLQTFLYPIVNVFLVCLSAWLLGGLWSTIAALLSTMALRLFSHGAHSNAPVTCILTSVVIFPALGKIATVAAPHLTVQELLPIIAAGFLLSSMLFWRLSPVDSPAKPITSEAERRRLRHYTLITACCIVALQIFILITFKALTVALALSLGVWWQAVSLTRAGHWLATLFDNIFEKGGLTGETLAP